MTDVVLALDIGTSSSRAIVFDSQGRSVDELRAQVHYEPRTDGEGAAEFTGDDLVDHISDCIDKVLARVDSGKYRLCAVGMCTFWHSMIGIDRKGKAVTPLYTWADTRPKGAAGELAQGFDVAAYHARTVGAIHPSYFPARLSWLRKSEPELFEMVDRWVSPGEYLYNGFFGEMGCSVSMASGTGLFNQNQCAWDSNTLDFLPISAKNLSPIIDIDTPARGLVEPWRSRWPQLSDVPWVPAIGDGASSNLGSGCDTDHRIAINLGTSGAIRVLWSSKSVEIPPELWCYRLDRDRLVRGGAFSDGGSVFAWMRDTLKLSETSDSLEKAIEAREPFAHGLLFLPFLSGERSTGWRPEASATIHGLRSSTEPIEILQASMEGVALRFSLVAELLGREFPQASEIRASGGALGESETWAQMICDALGKPIIVTAESEASSRGAALVALSAAGFPTDEQHVPLEAGRKLKPNSDRVQKYRIALERQQDLYQRLHSF